MKTSAGRFYRADITYTDRQGSTSPHSILLYNEHPEDTELHASVSDALCSIGGFVSFRRLVSKKLPRRLEKKGISFVGEVVNTPGAESNGSLYVWKPDNKLTWPEPVTEAAEARDDLAYKAGMLGVYNHVPGRLWKIDIGGGVVVPWTTKTHGYDARGGLLDGLFHRAAKLVPSKKPAGK